MRKRHFSLVGRFGFLNNEAPRDETREPARGADLEDKRCQQCETIFAANNVNHRYCSRECQIDAYRGRPKDQSISRRDTGFAWPPPRPANPVVIKVPPLPKKKGLGGTWKTAVILPDPQFGYHRMQDDTLISFHDEHAIDIALQVVRDERPDVSVWLGDVMDLPMAGKYRQDPSFALTLQPAIDRAHEVLATVAALSGESRYLSGNHDERLHNSVIDNLAWAAGIRHAKASPHDWPLLSIPSLLRLSDHNIHYIGRYPAGASYLNDNLACVHGRFLGNKRNTAAQQVVEEERVSIIYGHTHHRATASKTRNSRGFAVYSTAHSPGCLCRVDGTVPSTRGGGIDIFGNPVKVFEDWQQGVTVVRYEEGDGRFILEEVPIYRGDPYWAIHKGQEYNS